jgi:NADH-quinone oxidoreductase subunit N
MYFRDPSEDFGWVKMNVATTASIILAIVGVLLLGILPGPVMELAKLSLF